MKIDHLFIFSPGNGKEVEDLVAHGFSEGSGRMHEGIGTRNRRVFFDNFYLEILWVHNEPEARKSGSVGIWERANFRQSHYSPFGICLAHAEDLGNLFENSIQFQPDFVPEGKSIEIITNERMPWIFKFPSTGRNKKTDEPTDHPNGVRELTAAAFNLQEMDFPDVLRRIEEHSIITFNKSDHNLLVLEFDNGNRGETVTIEELHLTIHY